MCHRLNLGLSKQENDDKEGIDFDKVSTKKVNKRWFVDDQWASLNSVTVILKSDIIVVTHESMQVQVWFFFIFVIIKPRFRLSLFVQK